MKNTENKDLLKDFLLKTTNKQDFIAKKFKLFFTDIDRQTVTYLGDLEGKLLLMIWMIKEIAMVSEVYTRQSCDFVSISGGGHKSRALKSANKTQDFDEEKWSKTTS